MTSLKLRHMYEIQNRTWKPNQQPSQSNRSMPFLHAAWDGLRNSPMLFNATIAARTCTRKIPPSVIRTHKYLSSACSCRVARVWECDGAEMAILWQSGMSELLHLRASEQNLFLVSLQGLSEIYQKIAHTCAHNDKKSFFTGQRKNSRSPVPNSATICTSYVHNFQSLYVYLQLKKWAFKHRT